MFLISRYAQEFLVGGPSFLRRIAHLTPQTQPEVLLRQFSVPVSCVNPLTLGNRR
jgi:hypothetical protein